MPTSGIQLITRGEQAIYLDNSLQVTQWTTTYRRHTNFASEPNDTPIPRAPDTGAREPFVIISIREHCTITYIDTMFDEDCMVCLETTDCKFQCNHHVCTSCNKNMYNCPYCRQSITEKFVHK